jgi:hypothetical protein
VVEISFTETAISKISKIAQNQGSDNFFQKACNFWACWRVARPKGKEFQPIGHGWPATDGGHKSSVSGVPTLWH